jgi:alkyldihydroxyacetonephosphate synthase
MRRWNGWGDESVTYPLPSSARDYLERILGKGSFIQDVSLEDSLALVPPARISKNPLIKNESIDRLTHARGQSLPDWIALRSGRILNFPDGVAYPENRSDLIDLMKYSLESGAKLIPYGGGTSVVGHINPLPSSDPVLTVDLSNLKHLLGLDETSRLATFEAGISGPQIEKILNAHGYTLGHFPQSFEFSTLGGWIATRSSGQQSYHYGRIEDLFAGGRMETFHGPLEMPVHPASAAGPDLKQVVLGSEGRFGIISSAVVRIQPLPEVEMFKAAFFHDWESGSNAVREIAQAGIPVSMLRLSNSLETETTLALSGKDDLVHWADLALNWIRYDHDRCLLIYGLTGTRESCRYASGQVTQLIRSHKGLPTGSTIGKMWQKSRFLSPYLRNSLWEAGFALDTLETALPWSKVEDCALEVLKSLQHGLQEFDEQVLVFAHLSHVYKDGASLYVTYLYRRTPDPHETLHRWQLLKSAASRVIINHHGTISHQHGVGLDHKDYLVQEKGRIGMQMLETLDHYMDPTGTLNPGKLFPDGSLHEVEK